MSEHRHRPSHALLATTSDWRVIESGMGDSFVLLIRRVHYDCDGVPLRYDAKPPKVEARSGDGLLALINDMAMGLSRPSLLESEFDSVVIS